MTHPTPADAREPRAGAAPLDRKETVLYRTLADLPSLIIAYSGGVDSALLAYAATRVLGRQAVCVTADSPSYPERHRQMAVSLSRQFGFNHEIIRTARDGAARVPRQPGEPLLLLQAGAVHAPVGARARTRHPGHRRRQQRR